METVTEYWVRHLPSGTLSPVGERDVERFEEDPDYEFLEAPPGEALATAWEVYEVQVDAGEEGGGWYVRPHGSDAPTMGPYETEGRATGALKRSHGSDSEIVVTPAGPGAEPPAEPEE